MPDLAWPLAPAPLGSRPSASTPSLSASCPAETGHASSTLAWGTKPACKPWLDVRRRTGLQFNLVYLHFLTGPESSSSSSHRSRDERTRRTDVHAPQTLHLTAPPRQKTGVKRRASAALPVCATFRTPHMFQFSSQPSRFFRTLL